MAQPIEDFEEFDEELVHVNVEPAEGNVVKDAVCIIKHCNGKASTFWFLADTVQGSKYVELKKQDHRLTYLLAPADQGDSGRQSRRRAA